MSTQSVAIVSSATLTLHRQMPFYHCNCLIIIIIIIIITIIIIIITSDYFMYLY